MNKGKWTLLTSVASEAMVWMCRGTPSTLLPCSEAAREERKTNEFSGLIDGGRDREPGLRDEELQRIVIMTQ